MIIAGVWDFGMWPDYTFLSAVSRRVGGAFYLFDGRKFHDNYVGLRDQLRSHWPNTELAYAMKANYMPPIGRLLLELNGWAEVVSAFEYRVASASLPADRIIFNGPIKSEQDLREALETGSQVNLDSFREIQLLEKMAPEFERVEVGLRVCFDFPELASRFGFEVESGELDEALLALGAIPGLNVVGLHCHATRRPLGVADPVERVERLCRLAGQLLPRYPIRTINIGGGLLGDMPGSIRNQFSYSVPSLTEYADAIGRAFVRCSPTSSMRLIVEPGTSMVANSMSLIAPVIETRKRRGGWQALLDTGINSLNPTRSSTHPSLKVVSSSPPEAHRTLREYRLVGNTCMEHDILCDSFSGHLEAGDFVVFESRGAYSLNYTPPFIVPCPAVVDCQGRLLKRADSPDNILASYLPSSHAGPEEAHHEYHAD
ncbi:alanine racemase [Halomonas saccharevitans]|uniref:Diaminopimelate decarboxylase n=1 Tax=Halomonas saccharevitans TaxID=416872 RepID=A0A1I7BDU5_9GAMM|nr:alanine racemase [Halomonas saccharevitans]SFT85334.1 diaminopimelate decarboxylase [Halomonas saccharevitans]